VGLAALLVALPADRRITIGRPGDARVVSQFGPPARHLGQYGRWSAGEGRLRLPPTGLPATVTLRLHGVDGRLPERVRLRLDDADAGDVEVGPGWQTASLPVGAASVPRTLTIASAVTTSPDGERRGVFLSRVQIRESGAALARFVPVRTWVSALLLLLGVVAIARLAAAAAGAPPGPIAAGMLAWTTFCLWLFRGPLSAWWPAFALAVWTTAALARATRGVAIGPARAAALFATGATGLVLLLFVEAVTSGAVLSQAQMLDQYYPWRAYLADAAPLPTPPFGDVPMLVYPFLAFARERLLEGAFPLWTASVNAGQPFFAAYQTAVLSPMTWTALLVPLPHATVVIAALRLLVGGLGMFVFLRSAGLSAAAAGFGGIGYLLNPFSLVWLEHPPGGVPPWLPWMLYAANRCAAGRRFGAAGLAVATALVLLGGHPHTGLFSAALASAYGLCAALEAPPRARRAAMIVLALAVGVLVASVQILPFLEYLASSRGAQWRGVHALNPFHAPASAIVAGLVPNFFGDHHTGNYAGPLNYLEQVIYAGMPVLVVSGVALASPRRSWRVAFFAAAAVLATLVVYGAPLVNHVISSLPLVKAATLTRMPIVAITSLIVLGAIGIDRLLAATPGAPSRRALAGAGVVAITALSAVGLAYVAQRPLLARGALTDYTIVWALWSLALAAGAWLLVAGCGRAVLSAGWTTALLTGLLALDLFVFGRGFHGMLPPDRVFPVLPEVARIHSEPEPSRVLGVGGALMPNAAMVYGLQDVRAYDGLGISWYADLLDVPLVFSQAHQLHEAHRVDSPILDLLNVRYVLAPPEFAPPEWYRRVDGTRAPLFRNTRALPRAFLVDGYVVLSGNPARRALRDGLVDVRRQAILEADPPSDARPQTAATAADLGTAAILAYDHERVEIEYDAPARRLLVLSDAYFPGWRATIDGAPVEIARANFALRAVPAPAGRHRVVFEYAPASFRTGLALSLAALVVLAASTFIEWRRLRAAAGRVVR
jgi:hypothetical protein